MVACFIGHRKISVDEAFISDLKDCIRELITNKNFDTFLFGSRSEFDDICLKAVTALKNDYPDIRRVYVRAAYPYISEDYKKYLLTFYDETYMPEAVKKAGKASYIERNQHMIDRSDLCVFYYDERYSPPKKQIRQNHFLSVSPSRSNSGTKLAYQYAMAHKKVILNLFPMPQN